ncbi:MAG: methyltransferase type 11 [Elusimicrobia bacterium]|nr:MAG: methyltransferase type 11 [Elusimicrobiota bacterium]
MRLYPKTKRNIDERAALITPEQRQLARQFGKDFFDGNRLYGYGGFGYNSKYWHDTVRLFRDHYELAEDSSVLDVGCAKGFMLHDFKEMAPKMTVAGIDISEYAIANSIPDVAEFLKVGNAKWLPYEDDSFDLVISVNTVHNLELADCKEAIKEIQRVSRKHAFLVVDAWRNDHENERLEKWNLTALTKMHVDDWQKIFAEVGYTGDFFWFIAG